MDRKTVTEIVSDATMNPQAVPDSKVGPSNAELVALWSEARLAYPLYAALAVTFNLASPPYCLGELPPSRPTRSGFDRDLKWLDSIDEHLLAYQLRQVPSEMLNGNEPSLRAFIQRQLRKTDKTTTDRDKVDWLLMQYFALCAPEDLYRQQIKLEDVARVLRPVVPAAHAAPLEWCEPLEKIFADLDRCRSLRDIMENGLLEQGRLLKDAAGCMFYDPAALVAFCRFNFLLRRAFIRLLHADLRAMGEALDALQANGKKTVDCRRAGFSAAETISQLRYFCANWKQPFQKDYTESSVTRSFDQLLALRTDLEEALGWIPPKESKLPQSNLAPDAKSASDWEFGGRLRSAQGPSRQTSPLSRGALADSTVKRAPVTLTGTAEADKCLEGIWEQLIAGPPSPGRSMSTVTLQNTRVLVSSWEVTAFVSEGGQGSEDLRRAVVADVHPTSEVSHR